MQNTATPAAHVTPAKFVGNAMNLPLELIQPSTTNPRKTFDNASLQELANSIRHHGILQPLLVRPSDLKPGAYELIAGERRWRAAQIAEQEFIPVIVRDLDDKDALEIQVIENLQRADLHPLEEAEGYELLMKKHSYTPQDIAAKIGKSREYVYSRLKLTALTPKSRDLFYKEKLTASIALLVARIPVAKLQDEAAETIIDRDLNTRNAFEMIQENFMLRLKDAPFPTNDADLVAASGSCSACPKRSGNQRELFSDIKAQDMCTDTACYEKKMIAFSDRVIKLHEAEGHTVISGAEAKKLKPHEYSQIGGGYVDVTANCWDDAKHRTYDKIMGKDAPPPVIVVDPHHPGKIYTVAKESDIKPILKDKGIGVKPSRSNDTRAKEAAARLETKINQALLAAVRQKYPATLGESELRDVAQTWFWSMNFDAQKQVCAVWDWPVDRDQSKKIKELTEGDLARLLLDMSVASEIKANAWSNHKPERLLSYCKRYKIDAEKIRAEVKAQEKQNPKAVKTAKPKKQASAKPRKPAVKK
jgi:ParB/RepB/Spo0J family partition protein